MLGLSLHVLSGFIAARLGLGSVVTEGPGLSGPVEAAGSVGGD